MRRLITIAVCLALPALFIAATAPETVTLDGCGEKGTPVTFPHQAHVDRDVDCVKCHHTNEGLTAESDAEVAGCKSCHLNPEAAETPDCAQMSLKKNPFHAFCIDCHKTEEAGATKCTECHPK